MAYQRKEREGQVKQGIKPWFSDWVVAAGESCYGELHEIKEVRETASRAGYMLMAEQFNIMVYKSNVMADEVIDEVDKLYNSPSGGALFIEIDPQEELGFALGTDIELSRTWMRTKKFPGGYRYSHDPIIERKRARSKNRLTPLGTSN